MSFLNNMGTLTKRKFTLNDPNTVTSEDGSSGTWTMIYDEGFEVAVDEFVYFAFSKFTFTDPGQQHNVSHCDRTQIGWYHDVLRSRWGCYVGKKVGLQDSDMDEDHANSPAAPAPLQHPQALALQAFGSEVNEAPAPEARDTESSAGQDTDAVTEKLTSWLDSKDLMAAVPDPPSEPVLVPTQAAEKEEENVAAPAAVTTLSADEEKQDQEVTYDDQFSTPPEYKPWVPNSAGFDKPMASPFQESVAAALNFLQLGWTAHAYDQFHGKTPRELNRYAGVRRGRLHKERQPHQDIDQGFTSFLGVARKVRRHHHSLEPEELDWRNKDGQNWLEPVVTQGDCGSCYTISTVHMLTARNKIHSGSVSEPSFSVSFPLYCSEYNQGCDGGYGFLQSKWTEDVGLIPEKCAPFSQGGGSCSVSPNCNLGEKRYRAAHHHYVGGYYGASDADVIRKELAQRGPVVMSFEPAEDFMYYKNGVYRSAPHKIHQEWEQVDHAVLLIGYGADNGNSFWTMQNSWGSDWGEDGYFRMARGTDESGCESIVVAADVLQEGSNQVLDDFLAAL